MSRIQSHKCFPPSLVGATRLRALVAAGQPSPKQRPSRGRLDQPLIHHLRLKHHRPLPPGVKKPVIKNEKKKRPVAPGPPPPKPPPPPGGGGSVAVVPVGTTSKAGKKPRPPQLPAPDITPSEGVMALELPRGIKRKMPSTEPSQKKVPPQRDFYIGT